VYDLAESVQLDCVSSESTERDCVEHTSSVMRGLFFDGSDMTAGVNWGNRWKECSLWECGA
jgi:hypothetical protein